MNLRRLGHLIQLGTALTLTLTLAGSAGCGGKGNGGNGPAPDAGFADSAAPDAAAPDAPAVDTGAPDLGAPDLGPGVDAAPDGGVADSGRADSGPADSGVPPPIACQSGALIDLNRSGTKTGSTTSYVGNNDSAPPTSNVQGPSCAPSVGHEVVFSYTPYSTTKLNVSTNYTETSTDTVVWVLDRCASSMATELGCNDDAFVPPRPKASTLATDIVRAGAPIDIVVSGFRRDHGTFHLNVRELTQVSLGGSCDLTGLNDYCSADAHCLGSRSPGHCYADGSSGGVCRSSGDPCDANFACNGMPGDYGARCVPLLMTGQVCDPMEHDNRCAAPNQCSTASNPPVCAPAPYAEARVSPAFIDACAMGMRVSNLVSSSGADPRDDGHSASALTIPFSFQFFGSPQTMIWPDTNGYAVFGSMAPHDLVGGPAAVPEAHEGALVAPLFEDLVLGPSPASDLCWVTVGAAPNRQMVIEWQNAYPYGASMHENAHLTFELVLSETSNTVDFIYQHLDSASGNAVWANGSEAAIEVQAASGTSYAAHRGTITTDQGLRFSPR